MTKKKNEHILFRIPIGIGNGICLMRSIMCVLLSWWIRCWISLDEGSGISKLLSGWTNDYSRGLFAGSTGAEGALEKYIRDGRIVIGPWYILQDAFLTSSEANVRNMQIGHQDARALRQTFENRLFSRYVRNSRADSAADAAIGH